MSGSSLRCPMAVAGCTPPSGMELTDSTSSVATPTTARKPSTRAMNFCTTISDRIHGRIERTLGPWPDARAQEGFTSLEDGSLLVVAGNGGPGLLRRCLSDTWHLQRDSESGIWTGEKLLPGGLPSLEDGVLIATRNKTVPTFIPGGCEENELGYTFALDLLADYWKPIPWGPDGPVGRFRHVAVTDTKGTTVYLWGGFPALEAIVPGQEILWSRVWAYDVQADSWNPLTDGSTGPHVRSSSQGAFDTVSEQFLIFGGQYFFPPQSHLYGDLWAFNPKDNSWRQLLEDRPELARTQSAGAYCPCEGGVVITGGRNTAVGQRGTSETSAVFVPVEHQVDAVWINPASRGPQRQLQLTWKGPSETNLELASNSIVLRDCRVGAQLGAATRIERQGRGRWLAQFRDVDWERADALAARDELTVTGAIVGDNIKMLGRVAAPAQSRIAETVLQPAVESTASQLQVRTTGAHRWHLAWGSSLGRPKRVDVFDIVGRRVDTFRAGSSSNMSATDGMADIDGTGWRTGVYFVKVRFEGGTTQRTRLVNIAQ
jgi:hypothetical protein